MADYGTDLAYIHDAGFGEFALRSAPGLLSLLRRNRVDHGLVVDLGCGSGIWARHLGFAGYDVVGVDASPAMIRLARAKAPRAKLTTGSLTEVALPPCDAVTSIGECLSYAFARDKSGAALQRFFRRVYCALRPGGVFLFDLAASGREPAGMPRKSYWTGDDWAVLVEASEDPERHLLTRRLVSFRRAGRLYRRNEETHVLRLYEIDPIRDALAGAGFVTKPLRGFGQVRFRAGHFGLLACKGLLGPARS
ncbi:MAG: class I SAM-dependent methyltransferase [Bryobacteraceae bacterium]|jgi:SAM-dependent methyltransferase